MYFLYAVILQRYTGEQDNILTLRSSQITEEETGNWTVNHDKSWDSNEHVTYVAPSNQ